jgi:hypothetical protein
MLTAAIFFAAGLLVGWNLLPQPEWVQKLWQTIIIAWETRD